MRFLAILVICTFLFQTSNGQNALETSSQVVEIIEQSMKLNIFQRFENATLFKNLGFSLEYVSAALSVFRLLRGFFNNDENTFENEALKKLDQISQKLDEISSSVGALDERILTEINWVIVEMKTKAFKDISIRMAAAEHLITTLINSYGRRSQEFVRRINQFIEQQEREANEFKMVALFDKRVGHSQSIVDEILKFGQQQSKSNTASVRTSTAKMIYDFYIDVLRKILRSYTYRELAINLKNDTIRVARNNINFLINDKNAVLKILMESYESISKRLDDDDFKAFLNLRENGEHRMVKFKNVFQTFMTRESNLEMTFNHKTGYSCRGKCQDYKNVVWYMGSSDGCRGTVRYCDHRNKFTDKYPANYIRYQNPRTDRIYDAYKYFPNDWYGLPKRAGTNDTFMKGYSKGFRDCDVCLCECDNHDNPLTVRRFYTGRVHAPEDFVVTGVRFAERHNSIYLQIQVGKLLPTAIIETGSVHWQDLPDNNDFATHTWNNRLDLVLGDEMKFDSLQTIVTGVQLLHSNGVITPKMYGREIIDVSNGILSEDEVTVSMTNHSRHSFTTGKRLGLNDQLQFLIEKNSVLKFRQSDDETDAGQNFVPFFDANTATFDTVAPISSFGLLHYTTNSNFAGYIRPIIKSSKAVHLM